MVSTILAAQSGVPVRYQLDHDAMVSLNITRPDGWVVRELLIAEKQAKGGHEVIWDGRDDLGYLLPPGDYQARLLSHDGLAWHYLTSVGNSGTPPWRTPDGTGGWGGNHGQNTAVAADETGARNALTTWWRSVSADAHANNDIPTEIRLYPAEWGQLLLQGVPIVL